MMTRRTHTWKMHVEIMLDEDDRDGVDDQDDDGDAGGDDDGGDIVVTMRMNAGKARVWL